MIIIAYIFYFRSEDAPCDWSRLLPFIRQKQLDTCFHRAFSVIDLSFLDKKPVASRTGTVRSTLSNLVASAASFHLEVTQRTLSKEEAADLIYDLDKLTDFDHWVPPLNPFAGPAGARRPKRKSVSTPKRVLKFVREDGSSINIETGGS